MGLGKTQSRALINKNSVFETSPTTNNQESRKRKIPGIILLLLLLLLLLLWAGRSHQPLTTLPGPRSQAKCIWNATPQRLTNNYCYDSQLTRGKNKAQWGCEQFPKSCHYKSLSQHSNPCQPDPDVVVLNHVPVMCQVPEQFFILIETLNA